MKKSRLRKIAEDTGVGNGASLPTPIFLNNPLDIVDHKNEITDITYGPSISREWTFEQPLDNPEWRLRSSN